MAQGQRYSRTTVLVDSGMYGLCPAVGAAEGFHLACLRNAALEPLVVADMKVEEEQ